MPSDCPSCSQAAQVPDCGLFTVSCRQCTARAVSRGPDFFASKQRGTQTRDYRELLERMGLTHEEVLAARDADASHSHAAA